MEENKNLNTTPEAEETVTEVNTEKPKKVKKPKKEKLLKNEALFKKGSYSIALTAIVLVGVIVLNVLVSALSDRFVLEFDMTAEKENSISEENIDYIKTIDEDVNVIVCATEDAYASYVGSMAQSSYSVYDENANSYYLQTVKLINKYNAYNDKIKVQFVDTQSSEFTAITSKYGSDNLEYGSIIVSAVNAEGDTRYKKLGFTDIYELTEDQSYASMGMSMSTISGNNIETALTGAVSYVLSDIDVKVAFITGHSPQNIANSYKELLEKNNYQVDVIDDGIVNKISNEYDVVVIPAPNKDFVESELNALSEFLNNNKKLGKGMMVFADASAPYLKDFYSFLNEWGVDIGEGILYETDQNYHVVDDPTTMASANSGNIKELADLQLCITGFNVPMEPAFETEGYKKAVSVVTTTDSVAEAPKGVTANWSGAADAGKTAYSTVIETVHSDYDSDNNAIESTVTVFASPYFLGSDYNESANVANKDFTLAMMDRMSGAGETDISFVSKSITNESFYDSVTQGSANAMRIIFMFVLPLAVVALGIVIFVKRRNA